MVTRRVASEDPASLIKDSKGMYILDEIQYAPEILSYLKELVDLNQIDAQFVLTGSNQFAMMRDLSQSLAGRAAVFELLPFSISEVYDHAQDINTCMYKGLYPRLVQKSINPAVFYDSYIRTYLQRDVRLLVNVQNMDAFTRFLSLCAGRTGCILNKVSLANDAGVDAKTVSNWLSVLQASYIIYLLPPWHGNVSKRLIKSSKLYFLRYRSGLPVVADQKMQMISSATLCAEIIFVNFEFVLLRHI
ncbi:MAG: AAA family ATPase, partial [Candidatus Cloacimonetes bacterium]|nr:AAA family ATPase [Candidatus Cloacimonadota bacterium]